MDNVEAPRCAGADGLCLVGQPHLRLGHPLDTGPALANGAVSHSDWSAAEDSMPAFRCAGQPRAGWILRPRPSRSAGTALLPVCQAHADPARPGVDEAVVEVLGLPEAALPFTADLRLLWDGNLQCMTTGGPLPCSMPNGGPRAARSPFVDTGLHTHRPANRWYRVHNVSMVPPPP